MMEPAPGEVRFRFGTEPDRLGIVRQGETILAEVAVDPGPDQVGVGVAGLDPDGAV